MENNCIYCESTLPQRGYFCLECREQVKCKSCNELLEPSAKICVMCGAGLIDRTVSAQMNTIEFSETRSGRTFKATFTDTVGSNINETFNFLLANRLSLKSAKSTVTNSDDELQDSDFQEEPSPSILIEENNKLAPFKEIFYDDSESISLIEPRLKATSKADFAKRLTCLYLYYQKLKGLDRVSRNEITKLAGEASVYNGNFRAFIASESNLFRLSGDELQLLLPGIEFAKQVLTEVADTNVVDKWKVGTLKKSTKRQAPRADNSAL